VFPGFVEFPTILLKIYEMYTFYMNGWIKRKIPVRGYDLE